MQEFGTFEDFYPYYVSQHSKPATRWVHFAGTHLGAAVGIAGVARRKPALLAAAPVISYGLAWFSHFTIEGNKPAHNALLYTNNSGRREIGNVSSAIWSPTCKRNIALAMVDAPYFKVGSTVWAEIYLSRELVWERRMSRARVVERPFFAPERRRATPPGQF